LIPGASAALRLGGVIERDDTGYDRFRISAPMHAKDGVAIGSIIATRPDGPPFNKQDAAVLAQLAHVVAVAIENLELLERTRNLAVQAERAKDDEAEARRAIESVFATMSEGVYALDGDGRLTFLNANAERMLARPRQELNG